MRREQFTLEVLHVEWVDEDTDPEQPVLSITFDGDKSTIKPRLTASDGAILDDQTIDISIRLQDAPENATPGGVIAVTNREIGEYIAEINVDMEEMLTFITAARRYGESTDDIARYAARINTDDGTIASFEKRTLLVYSNDGELLRQHSLIPSGVEI